MSEADMLADEAYREWELLEYERAAFLFFLAAAAEEKAAAGRHKWAAPNQAILHELRGGYCLWESGDRARAAEYLEKVRGFDWKEARLWGDRRDFDKAYTYLLLTRAASGDKKAFAALFKEAVRVGEELDSPFSSVIPNQKKLLLGCLELDYAEGLETILSNVESSYIEKDAELQLVVSQAQKRLGM